MNINMNMDENKTESSPPLTELILSLEQATLMAKRLAATTDPTHLLQIYSFLHQAHHHLSSFLSSTQIPVTPPPQQPPVAENSLSSATGAVADDNGSEPMEVGEDEGENSKTTTIDKIEERMKECFIKNKRPKRPLSPSAVAAAEEKRLYEDGFVGGANGFDPHATKMRALDLVFQFHG